MRRIQFRSFFNFAGGIMYFVLCFVMFNSNVKKLLFFATIVQNIYVSGQNVEGKTFYCQLTKFAYFFSHHPLLKHEKQHQYLNNSFNVFLIFIAIVLIIITFMDISSACEIEQ